MSEKGRRIWLHIGDRDCVAAEVKYHRKCYYAYTNPLVLKAQKRKRLVCDTYVDE
jgi:hypothetical protein